MKKYVIILVIVLLSYSLFIFSSNHITNEKRLKVLSSQTINNKQIEVVKDIKSGNQYFLISQYGTMSLTKIDQVNKTVVVK